MNFKMVPAPHARQNHGF